MTGFHELLPMSVLSSFESSGRELSTLKKRKLTRVWLSSANLPIDSVFCESYQYPASEYRVNFFGSAQGPFLKDFLAIGIYSAEIPANSIVSMPVPGNGSIKN